MATLRHLATQALRPLPARLLVGRAPACALCLDDRRVSGEHATIRWTGHQWEIRDLGSRNGTFVDGRRLASGERIPLDAGARMAFGGTDDLWELVDTGPPSALGEDRSTGAICLAVEFAPGSGVAVFYEDMPVTVPILDDLGGGSVQR